MEALSRRGSNPDTLEISVGSETAATFKRESMHPLQQSVDRSKQTCVCLCSGWAEILIRRPTGNMSWMMRIQNQMSLDAQNSEIPLQNLISQVMPSLGAIYPNCESWTLEPSRNHTSKTSSLTEISQIQCDSTTGTRSPIDSTTTTSATQATETSVATKKRSVVVDAAPTMFENCPDGSSAIPDDPIDSPRNRLETCAPSASHRTTPELAAAATSDDKTSATLLSGPIDIPKSTHAYKIPSGSFSDVEPDLDDEESNDVAFEENDSRSRNPVRRVNSSPEMSSNYRHPFVAQKAATAAQTSASAAGANVTNIHVTSSEEDATVGGDTEQQQKKKNFSKERVNCEAIPEEITDSTPPSHHPIAVERQHSNEEKMKASRSAANTCASLPASRGQSADTLLPNASQSNLLPRKQHSADDALQQRSDQMGDEMSIAASTASSSTRSLSTAAASASTSILRSSIGRPTQYATNRRNNIALAAATSSAAAAMGVPLSPRLLAKTGGMSLLGSGGGANVANDLPRGRSKTISVVRERGHNETDARHMSRWTFKGSKCSVAVSFVML